MNGAGKSSFADALEYLVKGGKINHLSHEYSGPRQKLGIRNTHAPKGTMAKVNIHFHDGEKLGVVIDGNSKQTMWSEPPEAKVILQSWDLERLILRQDEVAQFIHATKGEKYSVLPVHTRRAPGARPDRLAA